MKALLYFCVGVISVLFVYHPEETIENKTYSERVRPQYKIDHPELKECDRYRQKIKNDLKEIKQNINTKK